MGKQTVTIVCDRGILGTLRVQKAHVVDSGRGSTGNLSRTVPLRGALRNSGGVCLVLKRGSFCLPALVFVG